MTENEKAVLTHMLLSIREQATAALRMLTAGVAHEQESDTEPPHFGSEEQESGE